MASINNEILNTNKKEYSHSNKRKGPRVGHIKEIGDKFNNGKSIKLLARDYGVNEETIINNLNTYVESHAVEGNSTRRSLIKTETNLPPNYDNEKEKLVFKAFDELGAERTKPVYDYFYPNLDYIDLKLYRAFYWSERNKALGGPPTKEQIDKYNLEHKIDDHFNPEEHPERNKYYFSLSR